jgi:hypothetical protein
LTFPEFLGNESINQPLPKMKSLRLSLLPSVRQNEESGSLRMEREGFVDEAAVTALLSGPTHLRSSTYSEDLALAADDLDFAGWQVPSTPVARPAEFPPQVIDAIVRRAAPPQLNEPGIGSPHFGSHRWWLAGLAGVFSTLLFALLLVTLSSRPQPEPEAIQAPAEASHPRLVMPRESAPTPEVAPELTHTSPVQP